MVKRIRKENSIGRSFLYYFVSERGKDRGRPHFHGLFFFPKFSDDDKLFSAQLESKLRSVLFLEWRRNYGSTRNPDWKPLFTYRSKYVSGVKYSNFDLHYVVPYVTENGSSDVAFYVTKYILKASQKELDLQRALRLNLSDDEFKEVWRIVRSKSLCSHYFGYATDREIDFVKSCIERSKDDPSGLKYFNFDGSSSPLCRRYRKFLSVECAESSFKAREFNLSERSIHDIDLSLDKSKKISSILSERDISELYPID